MSSQQKSKSSLSLMSNGLTDKSPAKSNGIVSQTPNLSLRPSTSVIYKKPILCQKPSRNSLMPASTEVRQRVLSARKLKIKSYQNQLTEAQQTIEDLLHENRLLQTLHKRQDTALSKYESSSAELPQLLHSHAEEVRMWQTKYKNIQQINKELEQKIKQKESIILSLTDQNKYYSQLNKDRNLLERQQLREENENLSKQLKDKEAIIENLRKKMALEAKNLKVQLQQEQKKSRHAIVEMEKCRVEMHAFNKLDQMNTAGVASKRLIPPQSKAPKKFESLVKPVEPPTLVTKRSESFVAKQETFKKNTRRSQMAIRNDRGDGDATVTSLVKQPQNPKSQPSFTKKEDTPKAQAQTPHNLEIKDSPKDSYFENNLSDAGNDNYIIEDPNIEDTESSNGDRFSETDFNTKRMRTDISNLRGRLLGEEYERREEFIDGFCLQNNIKGTQDEDDDEEKYRSYTMENLNSRIS